jgi:hypothetical protein
LLKRHRSWVVRQANKVIVPSQYLANWVIKWDVPAGKGDKQQKMSESEVLTVAFISHRYFGGNYKATLSFLSSANLSLFNNLLSNFYQKAVS